MAALTAPVRCTLAPAGRWLEVVSHTDPKYGGLSATVPALGRRVAYEGGFNISLAAFTAPDENFQPRGYTKEQLSFWPVSRKPWLRNQPLRASFEEQLRQVDGIHVHGLWEQSTAIAARTAQTLKVPYIVSAHGMLEPWALATKRLKKFVYAHLVERRNVAGAACLHALTYAEANHFVRFGARSPIAIIPNGVDIPRLKDPNLFLNRFTAVAGKRMILFLARLHQKKGLDILLEAWATVSKNFPDAHLVLAGPDSDGTEAKLKHFIDQHNLQSTVLFTGMLQGNLKWSALAAAECFVLPSYSEGLSVSVLEAMGMGVPVIVTEPCNMPEVVHFHTGWEIQPERRQLTSALADLLSNSPRQNAEVGARGAELVKTRYTWEIVASQMSEVYRWIQGGPRPTTVELVNPA